ncbi:MAG: methyltransferase [Fischerella sp. CENA71]|nr:methyltransferase [Fischerella sp. CENA71]
MIGCRQVSAKHSSVEDLIAIGQLLKRNLSIKPDDVALKRLFSGNRFVVDPLSTSIPSQELLFLKQCGLIDEYSNGFSSPFCIHLVEGLVLFSDPKIPSTEQIPSYLDPLWEAPLLTRLLVRGPTKYALDMGTGCGVLALVMSRYAEQVMAVDINPRALNIAQFNAMLNGVTNVEFLAGDLFNTIKDQRFDRIVFNSPTYDEQGEFKSPLLAGEQILSRFFSCICYHLTTDGYCQVNLAMNDYPDSSFTQRLQTWLSSSDMTFKILLLVAEEQRTEPLRCWRRGWLTMKPGHSWLSELQCDYKTQTHQVTEDAISNLIMKMMEIDPTFHQNKFDLASAAMLF